MMTMTMTMTMTTKMTKTTMTDGDVIDAYALLAHSIQYCLDAYDSALQVTIVYCVKEGRK